MRASPAPRPELRSTPGAPLGLGLVRRHLLETPAAVRGLARFLALSLPVLGVLLFALPWQQAAPGQGEVIAWDPSGREQTLQAPVDGRIARWHVADGDRVVAGQLLVELADNDARRLERLGQQAETAASAVEASEASLVLAEAELAAKQAGRALLAAEWDSKLAELERKRLGEVAERETALQQQARVVALQAESLASVRELELAELGLRKAEATLDARDAELLAARSAREKALASADAELASSAASIEKARVELADKQAKLLELESKRDQQSAQALVAPADGVVQALPGASLGAWVKEGQSLLSLVPESQDRVVAMEIDGNDMPLVHEGSEVRLVFEGWPALQVTGWPGTSVGTFGGRVARVDPAGAEGTFRVLVEAAPGEQWPDARLLRQGVRAKGWVLLGEVSVGYELWRQLNGFPPLPTKVAEGKGSS